MALQQILYSVHTVGEEEAKGTDLAIINAYTLCTVHGLARPSLGA